MPFQYPNARQLASVKRWQVDFQGSTQDAGGDPDGKYWNSKVSGTAILEQYLANPTYAWSANTRAEVAPGYKLGVFQANYTIDSNASTAPASGTVGGEARLEVNDLGVTLYLAVDVFDGTEVSGCTSIDFYATIAPPAAGSMLSFSVSEPVQPTEGVTVATMSCTVTATPCDSFTYFPIDVRHRAFIPAPAVCLEPAPITGTSWVGALFHGDNRRFDFVAGTTRSFSGAIVTLDPAADTPIRFGPTRFFGQTQAFPHDAGHQVDGQPWWWWELYDATTLPSVTDTQVVTDETNKVWVIDQGERYLRLGLHVSASIPAVDITALPAPNIDVDLEVLLVWIGESEVRYFLSGAHDGFPAHETYVQGVAAHQFDPVAAGTSPLNLYRENVILPPPPDGWQSGIGPGFSDPIPTALPAPPPAV